MKYENMEKAIELYTQAKDFKNELSKQKDKLSTAKINLVNDTKLIQDIQNGIELNQELYDNAVKALEQLD